MGAPKILLLIDDPNFRGALLPSLRAGGMSTLMTGDGAQARALVSSAAPNLIVVDEKIPGGGGLAWIRARRAEGLAIPIILCGSSNEEMRAFLAVADELGLASVVHRGVPPDAFTTHVVEVLAEYAAPARLEASYSVSVDEDVDDGSAAIATAVEQLRLSLARLQQDPQSRDRILNGVSVASQLAATGTTYFSDVVVKSAQKIVEILNEAVEGRRRMDNTSFAEIARFMARARSAVPGQAAASGAPPVTPRRAGAAAHSHEPIEARSTPKTEGVDDDTGLLSKPAFDHDVDEMVSDSMISGRPISICVLSIVGAEALGRTGHLPAVLRASGQFFAARFRPIDRRGRIAPAAFGLALPATPPHLAADLLVRTLEAFASVRIEDAAGGRITVAFAAGVASHPRDGADAAALLALAARQAGAAAAAGGGVRGR